MFAKPFDLLIFFVILKLGYVSLTTQNTNILCTDTIQEFTSENGTITSYNYPNQYTDNLSCQFRISVKSDEIINLKIETFATEATYDTLKIYDGYNTSSYLKGSYNGIYTGYAFPFRIASRSNYLFFNFTTDSRITNNGFKLNYKSIKKVSFESLTDSQGIIRSPDYPNVYPGGIKYSWKISAPPNYSIILEFKDFETSPFDFLELIELSNNKQITFAEYSGSIKPDRFLSNTNELVLNFTSNLIFEKKGFEIHYHFAKAVNSLISKPTPLSTLNTNILCERGIQEFAAGNGTITSYDYPNKYANNLNCQFRIGVNSDETIIVYFETFATEANHDILKIYYGRYSSNGSLIGSYSGNELPSRITAFSDHLYFNFTTDNNYTANGFKLNYKSIKRIALINLTESEGIIQTPEYPNNYMDELNYTWRITAPANNLISLEFNSFDTNKHQDYLQIIEVSDNKKTLLAQYSGSVKPENILSSSNEVILRFTSDLVGERKGFEISYKFIVPNNYSINRPTPLTRQNSNILCGSRIQEFTTQNGTITSYNYPDNYANNLKCQFRIVVEIDKIIIVDFETFLTEATHDILKIYNGPYKTSGLYNSYGGNVLPTRLISTSNSLYFNFSTSDAEY